MNIEKEASRIHHAFRISGPGNVFVRLCDPLEELSRISREEIQEEWDREFINVLKEKGLLPKDF